MASQPVVDKKIPRLAIVIPCYNEQAVLPQTFNQLLHVLTDLIEKNKISADSFLYCVDDGSKDDTWAIISREHHNYSAIKGLKLSGNVGHQNALLAGLMRVKDKVDCAISIDADLQDDVSVIAAMIDDFSRGSDIVYGVRQRRNTDTFFKRVTATLFYKMMKKSGSSVIENHADFRLLSQRALIHLSQFEERNLFLRGLIPLMGFQASQVQYDRSERLLGETKYTLKKMIALAWNGVTSYTHIPLQFILIMGVVSFFFSLMLIVWVFFAKIFSQTVPGWSSIMIPQCFMGGVQLLSIGILGDYIAKIYLEVKRRPRYMEDMEIF